MTMNRAATLLSILTVAMSFAFLSQAQSQNPPAMAAADPTPVLSVPKNYRYDAHGRRDPFVNPVPTPVAKKITMETGARPLGLKGVGIEEAIIAGVVTSKERAMNVVIISAPGVKTPYFAHIGDELYDGRVKSIKLDAVTFALKVPKTEEGKTLREIVRKVRPKPGEDR